MEYYAALYLRDSWSKIPTLLTNSDRDVKKRIKGFNEAFDQLYKKQSGWVLCDGGLRWKTFQLILQVIVPVYKSYITKYLALGDGGASPILSPNRYINIVLRA